MENDMLKATNSLDVSELALGDGIILCLFTKTELVIAEDVKDNSNENIATAEPFNVPGDLSLVTLYKEGYSVVLPVRKNDPVVVKLSQFRRKTGVARNVPFWLINLGTNDNITGIAMLTDYQVLAAKNDFMKISFNLKVQGGAQTMSVSDYTSIKNLPLLQPWLASSSNNQTKAEFDETIKMLVEQGSLIEDEPTE